tara:strand:+ start:2256 stop:3002 length:747 start_codon:yes stop_codon:yes gene_type:complete
MITNNKKYAILVHSELRQFELANQSWKFKDILDCDFYFSTWETSHQYNKKLEIDLFETVTESTIKKHIPNSEVYLTDEGIFSDLDELRNKALNIKLKYHWKKCLELIKNSNIQYDNVLLMRADLWIECNDWVGFFNNQSNSKLFANCEITDDEGHPFIHDMFLMGSLENIEKVINYFDESISLTHRNLANAILDNNLTVERKDIHPQVVRPNVRKFNTIDSKIVNECYHKWSSTHCEEDISFLNKKYK